MASEKPESEWVYKGSPGFGAPAPSLGATFNREHIDHVLGVMGIDPEASFRLPAVTVTGGGGEERGSFETAPAASQALPLPEMATSHVTYSTYSNSQAFSGAYSVRNLTASPGVETGIGLLAATNGMNVHNMQEQALITIRRAMQLEMEMRDDGLQELGRLSDEEISLLPRVTFTDTEQQHCAICLEAFKESEVLTALPCAHYFHVECVAVWMRRATHCPLCRLDCSLP